MSTIFFLLSSIFLSPTQTDTHLAFISIDSIRDQGVGRQGDVVEMSIFLPTTWLGGVVAIFSAGYLLTMTQNCFVFVVLLMPIW